MTSEILDDYNRQLEEQEICYKNNRGKFHFWESVNSNQISSTIIETEYCCSLCASLKYTYSYLDSEL